MSVICAFLFFLFWCTLLLTHDLFGETLCLVKLRLAESCIPQFSEALADTVVEKAKSGRLLLQLGLYEADASSAFGVAHHMPSGIDAVPPG